MCAYAHACVRTHAYTYMCVRRAYTNTYIEPQHIHTYPHINACVRTPTHSHLQTYKVSVLDFSLFLKCSSPSLSCSCLGQSHRHCHRHFVVVTLHTLAGVSIRVSLPHLTVNALRIPPGAGVGANPRAKVPPQRCVHTPCVHPVPCAQVGGEHKPNQEKRTNLRVTKPSASTLEKSNGPYEQTAMAKSTCVG